ncbi:MAG: hypothetical protein ACFCAD_28300 [Pleurocapsa sp.]
MNNKEITIYTGNNRGDIVKSNDGNNQTDIVPSDRDTKINYLGSLTPEQLIA